MITSEKPFVLLESPFSAPTPEEIVRNVWYAFLAVQDSLDAGEAPYASHLFFTQMLEDANSVERALGIDAGLAIGSKAEATVVYGDLGISSGMQYGIHRAEQAGRRVLYRSLFIEGLTQEEMYQQIEELAVEKHLPSQDVLSAIYARR